MIGSRVHSREKPMRNGIIVDGPILNGGDWWVCWQDGSVRAAYNCDLVPGKRYTLEDLTANNCATLHSLVCRALEDDPEYARLNGLKTLQRKLEKLNRQWLKDEHDRR